MKLSALVVAVAALVAAPATVAATSCTVANIDFLGTDSGKSCTLFNPALQGYLGPYGATVLEATLATFTDVSRSQVRALVNTQIAKQLSPALNVTITQAQLASLISNGIINATVGQTWFPAFVNYTIADQACYALRGMLQTITSCFNANCTQVAWQYCANPNSPPPAIAGSSFKDNLALVGVPLITGSIAACGGAAAYQAQFPFFQPAHAGINYTVTCQTLFPQSMFGTFVYATASPTPAPSSSSTLKAGIAAAASVLAAALMF